MSATAVGASWDPVAPDLWVGTQAGAFAGMIERHGRFTLLDEHGEWVGDYDALELAQEALRSPRDVSRRRRVRRIENALVATAGLSGLAALTAGVVGLFTVAAGL